jgi:hypothetical protein
MQDAVVTAPLAAAEASGWGNKNGDGGGLPPVVTTIIRGVPVAILRPMIGATGAPSDVLDVWARTFVLCTVSERGSFRGKGFVDFALHGDDVGRQKR